MQNQETMHIGGHRLIPKQGRTQGEFTCVDCGDTGQTTLFRVGVDVCPGRPESLNNLTVCAGGDACLGHMDTTTHQWRAWKDSPSLSSDTVPHYQCESTERGSRAAAHFLNYVGRGGMVVENWTTPVETVFNVNADGMRVADFDHDRGHYEVWVSRTGKITALRTEAAS